MRTCNFFVEYAQKLTDSNTCGDSAVPGLVLRELGNETGDRRDPGPLEASRRGPGSRTGPSDPFGPHAQGYDAGAMRHSVGGNVAISTNGPEVLQSGHGSDDAIPRNHLQSHDFWPLPASDLVSPLCTEIDEAVLTQRPVAMRWMG